MEKVAIVSACLLGEYCRYDGKTKKYEGIFERLENFEIIPFCPEAPILGTPRERISVIEDKNVRRVISDESKRDITELITAETKKLFTLKADLIILKSKSPSCGLGTTPLLSPEGKIINYGDGKAAELIKEHFKDATILDENQIGEI